MKLPIEVDMSTKGLARDITVEIDLQNYGQWRVRLWIAEKLFRLAAWIAWFDIDIEETEEGDYYV